MAKAVPEPPAGANSRRRNELAHSRQRVGFVRGDRRFTALCDGRAATMPENARLQGVPSVFDSRPIFCQERLRKQEPLTSRGTLNGQRSANARESCPLTEAASAD
jgi:hypothetical protein